MFDREEAPQQEQPEQIVSAAVSAVLSLTHNRANKSSNVYVKDKLGNKLYRDQNLAKSQYQGMRKGRKDLLNYDGQYSDQFKMKKNLSFFKSQNLA